MRALLKTLVLLMPLTGAAFAADTSTTCKPGNNQQEMNDCAMRDYRAADAALNIKYVEVMARLPMDGQGKLRGQQREWLKARELQCKADSRATEGGPTWTLDYFSCLRIRTEKRTAEIGRL
ncbi:MAG: lysozyme inhibitor LprI family protein [Pseudomonadota bacterium]